MRFKSRFRYRLQRVLVLLLTLYAAISFARGGREMLQFPPDLKWLNVERPLTAHDLQGRVVILDFWTSGCIDCMYVADELRRLEAQFGDRLVVVGVHTPKFDNEKNLATLRNTVIRWDRRHPIVSDPDWLLARRYGMRAWPTLVTFTPDGRYLGKVSGEGNEKRLERSIRQILQVYEGGPEAHPLPIALEKDRSDRHLLAAPGKVAVSSDGRRVAVSDTLHNRIVVAGADGATEQVFGGREPGFADGSAREARFNAPQGLVFRGDRLLVADTGNHALRRIDLSLGRVSTLAGTGRIGDGRGRTESGPADKDLRFPWALAVEGQWLYIAMAGSHQIWRMDLVGGQLGPYAGSGREGIGAGNLQRASFSQPSGLALLGGDLYVADAEASAVRRIRLGEAAVENLVGKGLFDFGDRDGLFRDARLQHVSGIATLGHDRLVIADTYNHKIKLLELASGRVTTLLGTGRPGDRLGSAAQTELNEPGGVAVLAGSVLVADTNNHRILSLDPYKGKVVLWRFKAPKR